MTKEEYEGIMSAWVDEVAPLTDGFASLFPETTEGRLKYLFAVNYMQLAVCFKLGIQPEQFSTAVQGIVGTWFVSGKPEGVEILCISPELVDVLKRHMAAKRKDEGGKPSSEG